MVFSSPVQPAYRRVVGSPFQPSDRTKQELKGMKHDGLCLIVQAADAGPAALTEETTLSFCWCQCKKCWDAANRKCICRACYCHERLL